MSSTVRGGSGRGGSNSGARGGHNNHVGGRGGSVAVRGGAGGGAGAGSGQGAPPQASRWGNGPPSASSPSTAPSTKNVPGNKNANHSRSTHQPPNPSSSSSSSSNNNNGASAFPSLASSAPQDDSQKLMRDRIMFLLVTLIGNPVTVTVKGGNKFFGIFSAANTEGGELGVALSSAQQILHPKEKGAKQQLGELKRTLIINAKDLESIEAAEIRVQHQAKEMREARQKETFRTDTEISKGFDPLGSERALQKWSDDPDLADLDAVDSKTPAWAATGNGTGLEDSDGKPWDQFAANEKRFGIKSDFEETMYTTTLDRSAKDFKDREREADRIAREILGQATNNPHMAEERGQADDSGVNEEDKYGAVVRNPNAYVPPALRAKQAASSAKNGSGSAATSNHQTKANGAPQAQHRAPAATVPAAVAADDKKPEAPAQVVPKPPVVNVKVPSPSIPQGHDFKEGTDSSEKKQPADASNPLMGDFRQFVSSERERLEKKKAALAKKEKDTRLADLKSWASSFKLKTPMPSDVADLVHKDKADSASDKPRDPSLQKSLSPTPTHSAAATSAKMEGGKLSTTRPSLTTASNAPSPTGGSGTATSKKNEQKLSETKAILQKMTIPKIPPFNPDKFKARQAAAAAAAAGHKPTDSADGTAKAAAPKAEGSMTSSVSVSSFKLSAKASSFKPFNPNAASFTPGGGAPAPAPAAAASSVAKAPAPSATASPASVPAAPANPFYGNRVLKKPSAGSGSLHVRDDFNPFKVSKVPDAKSIGPMWAFSGKPYRQHFVLAAPPGSMEEGSGMFIAGPGGVMHPAMHPGAQTPQSLPQQGHPGQIPVGGPQAGGPGGPAGVQPQPPFGMVYQPYGGAPYQFHGQPQPQGMLQGGRPGMPQPMQMGPSHQGGPMPYGAVPQQFMGQMPFSPPMHQHGAPQNMYSPQMGNMPPTSQQFIPIAPPPGSSGPRPPPPHLQGKGHGGPPGPGLSAQPPHMYYNQAAQPPPPVAAMPYPGPQGPQFGMQGGGPVGPGGGPGGSGGPTPPHQPRPPLESGPASSAASSSAKDTSAGN